jgi:hypothetical protein
MAFPGGLVFFLFAGNQLLGSFGGSMESRVIRVGLVAPKETSGRVEFVLGVDPNRPAAIALRFNLVFNPLNVKKLAESPSDRFALQMADHSHIKVISGV